jgi:hypothetical protein
MGIDWWESDPSLSSGARRRELSEENDRLRRRIAELEQSEPETAEPAGRAEPAEQVEEAESAEGELHER